MLRLCAIILLVVLSISHAVAGPKVAGQFDYYVLALSWSPSWCALEGDARNAGQCGPNSELGFSLHGLWPQHELGWPSFCQTIEPPPTRQATAEMADIMGSSGLAWHQWDKHGRCSGLSAQDYFLTSRKAYEAINRPDVFRQLLKPLSFPAPVVETAFLRANPSLIPDGISVTCSRGFFQEVRICLSKDLQLRTCGRDVIQDCQQRVVFPPLR
ncbi:MAG: ribonuclease T2 [Paracoccaceae bacterium]|jgi:ribonuclease T2